MFRLDADRAVEFCDGLRRRDFLHAGALPFFGLGLSSLFGLKASGAVDPARSDTNCILLMLVGGPSQLDTWDMKPSAPADIRGPYKPIKTNVPGIEISENFPRMAKHADKFSLVRSVYHTASAVHDTGHQLMQTGRFFQGGVEHPHMGCVVSKLKGARNGAPAHVVLPGPIGNTGGNMPHGQSAGYLGKAFDPFVLNADPSDPHFRLREAVEQSVSHIETSANSQLHDPRFHQAYSLLSSANARAAFELQQEDEQVRLKYGMNRFGQSCLLARRLVEAGVRFVTINMFETVFDEITWDIHGSRPFSPMSCYRDIVGPMFDMAYSSLLEDLHDRGLLANTMVVGFGEFGRTPKLNAAGGRDHWPQCWTILMGGGPLKNGMVVGSSDEIAGAPKDRPTTPAEVAATVYKGLGIDLRAELPGAQGRPIPLVERGVEPISELLA